MNDTTFPTANPMTHNNDVKFHRPELDGWRATAIIFVMIGHFTPIPKVDLGKAGVQLFFVLSGLLMANLLFVKREPIGVFLKRRISRVWPALFAFLFIICLTYPVPAVHIAATFVFVQNYATIYFGHMRQIDHLWSLSVEEWTYLFLGAIAICARARNYPAFPVLVVATIVLMINELVQGSRGQDYYSIYWRTDVAGVAILSGAVAFMALREAKSLPSWLPIVAGACGMILSFRHFPDVIKYSAGTICFAISIGSLHAAPVWMCRILSITPLSWCANISYSLYLWQQPYFKAIGHYPKSLLLAGAITSALASYYLIEQPARRFLNERWAQRSRFLRSGAQ